MLQVQKISKKFVTGDLTQVALDEVSLSLRDNEFVAILGPSGSGKTTLLNIIGGLDRYDSGDLIINNISTKKYTDRDWDSYRNHTIGFVFQSYNLIPHQTVLANVELALTISGVSPAERKERAKEALEKVGLGNQLHKKPNQMSGGQMQRVAIARALVNDPDILLADEPTGALDTKTSIQIMELLKEVAKDRLVVMVTHNPELAEEYATRIVQLKDGHILGDTNPFDPKEEIQAEHKNMGRSSMSFFTALSLSFNNLRTKKGRTFLTAFAGSIGIIGIAMILSLSTGVNEYINNIQSDTLSEYPLTLTETGVDFTSMMMNASVGSGEEEQSEEVKENQTLNTLLNNKTTNDLGAFRIYLESGKSGVEDYTNAVEYSYDVTPNIFRLIGEDDYRQINPDATFSSVRTGSMDMTMIAMSMNSSYFHAMPESESLYKEQYDVKAGRWPENHLECVVVLSQNSRVSDLLLYAIGLKNVEELDAILETYSKESQVKIESSASAYSYEDFLGIEFKLVDASAYYAYDEEYDVYVDKSDNHDYMLEQVKNGETMTIVGVVIPNEDATAAMLSMGIAYPAELDYYVMEKSAESDIVKKQLANPTINVFTGKEFGDEESEFDMESMFSIDEDVFAEAFRIDGSAFELDMSSLDMSGFDMSSMDIDMSAIDLSTVLDVSDLDIGSILSGIEIKINAEELQNLFQNVWNGYLAEAGKDPSTNYAVLQESMMEYLQSDEAKAIVNKHLQAMLADLNPIVSSEELTAAINDVMTGFQEYLVQYLMEQGMTDFSMVSEEQYQQALAAYLGTEEAQSRIGVCVQVFQSELQNIQITEAVLSAMMAELSQSYDAYAAQNGKPVLSKMIESFTAYVQSEQGQMMIQDGMNKAVNLEEIKTQLNTAIAPITDGYSQNMQNAMMTVMASYTQAIQDAMTTMISSMMGQMADSMANAFTFDAEAFSDAMSFGMDGESMEEMMISMMSSGPSSYSDNLAALNYAEVEKPSSILIYPKDFESKSFVIDILEDYNSGMEKNGEKEKVIVYTDTVGTMMSSITTIIDTISYMLIAFVSISLVVSSIMIGIITYISVLERTKEIGILRAIGASKHNISQVFNAETFIIGLLSGAIGIGSTLLLLLPANAIIHAVTESESVTAFLPFSNAVVLIALSVVLTLIGGFIPAKNAAKKDPVTALRSE